MSTDAQLEQWRRIVAPLKEAGVISYALVAVMPDGHVQYGGNFGTVQRARKELARHLAIIQTDLRKTEKALGQEVTS